MRADWRRDFDRDLARDRGYAAGGVIAVGVRDDGAPIWRATLTPEERHAVYVARTARLIGLRDPGAKTPFGVLDLREDDLGD